MRSEDETPAAERRLLLWRRLSAAAFEAEKEAAVQWSRAHGERLEAPNRRALAMLKSFSLSESTRALVVIHCYAEIPPDRTYDLTFDLESWTRVSTTATLLFGIFWQRVPIASLEHGHHQVAVFHFPNGVPPLIDTLPVDSLDQALWNPTVALCDSVDWAQIRGAEANPTPPA
jgi:hypothetical protein